MQRRSLLAFLGMAPVAAAGGAAVAASSPVAASIAGIGRPIRLGAMTMGETLGPGIGGGAVSASGAVRISANVDTSEALRSLSRIRAEVEHIHRLRRLCGIPDAPIDDTLDLIDGAGI